jgi:hypothetical protein
MRAMSRARLNKPLAGMRALCLVRRQLNAVMLLGLCACAAFDAHENFKEHMQSHIGRFANDPYAYPNRYPERVVGRHSLANGNTEIEYRTGVRGDCRVFFEVEKKTDKIIAWRYQGKRDVCAIAV